jgi:tetratricopeptide (TPR) repeat protein
VSEEQEKSPGDAEAPPAESAKPKKKKARAEGEGLEVIRDRNQRIREEAAQKRRTRREGERRPASAAGLDASEMMDDALARTTHVAAGWLKRHFNVIQWVVVVAAAGGIGWQVYAHQKQKSAGAAGEALMAAVAKENGRVGDEDDGSPDPRTLLADMRPHFATDADRLAAAASAYKAVDKGDNAKILARLGLAGVYFDQGKNKEALAEYRAVRESQLATQDSDVRARSVEGMGLAEEALGNTEGALKAFRELGNFDNASLSGLGLYHQARLAFAKGDKQQAQDLLKKVLEKVAPKQDSSKGMFGEAPGYVEQAAKTLLATIDPNAVPASPRGLTPEQLKQLVASENGEGGTDPEKLKELLKQITQNAPPEAPSGAPAQAPSGAPAPAPAPAGSP